MLTVSPTWADVGPNDEPLKPIFSLVQKTWGGRTPIGPIALRLADQREIIVQVEGNDKTKVAHDQLLSGADSAAWFSSDFAKLAAVSARVV
jgi:hypothetical protein